MIPFIPTYFGEHLFTASLQNLAVQQDFYSPLGVPWNDLANPVFDGVSLHAGFQEQGQYFFIGLSCLSLLYIVFYCFSLSLLSAGQTAVLMGTSSSPT